MNKLRNESIKAKFRVTKCGEFILDTVYLDGVNTSNIIVALDKCDDLEEDFLCQLDKSIKEY